MQGMASKGETPKECARKSVKRSRTDRYETSPRLKCKTCISCRRRKTKCDKAQPRCSHCQRTNLDCIYPDDARSLQKSHAHEIERLRSDVALLRRALRNDEAANSGPSLVAAGRVETNPKDAENHTTYNSKADSCGLDKDETGTTSKRTQHVRPPMSPSHRAQGSANKHRGPSSSELHLAGSPSDGVHGASSMLHGDPMSRLNLARPILPDSDRSQRDEMSRSRLVAYASQQHQMEELVRHDASKLSRIDFDGISPDVALHFLDAHFNRQHFTFMITYRPAIMDSLFNGGQYCNKILLNAIYLCSSIYSGSLEPQVDSAEDQMGSSRFLCRLRSLFADYIDAPSIPTAAGLLLSGAILVSIGEMSAGWVHTGIAYRMILDLGCHLAADDRNPQNGSAESILQRDIHVEVSKRLYWGAFLTDATQSLYFGRPPTLMATPARASHVMLDTFEELQVWRPYHNATFSSAHQGDGPYKPRPAYAISTFNSMIRLFEISTRIVNAFYSLESLQLTTAEASHLSQLFRGNLDEWIRALPDHLQIDLEGQEVFAPHQMTLLTTYHALQILVRRPCTANGHLSSHFNNDEQRFAELASIEAALAIHKLLRKYKEAFGLRRAPYLLSYCTYSAIVAILNQTSEPQSQFKDCMRFYWSALGELRRGSNFGLEKPMDILKESVNQFIEDIPDLVNNWDSQDMGMVQDFLNTDNDLHTASLLTTYPSNGHLDDILFGLFMNNTFL